MANEYRKDIVLVEVAYNWRPTEYKNKPAPFPETPEGQRQFLEEVNRLVLSTPDNRGKGVFWWEPAVQGGPRSQLLRRRRQSPACDDVFDKFTDTDLLGESSREAKSSPLGQHAPFRRQLKISDPVDERL
jgi:arabinogalactan endo-1,4-beta-galactosidase